MVSLWHLPNMEYVIGCVRIYACAYLLLNVLRVDRHVVSGLARLVLSIHDSKKGLYFTDFLSFFLQARVPRILHEALPILIYPMNKIQYA